MAHLWSDESQMANCLKASVRQQLYNGSQSLSANPEASEGDVKSS